MIVLSRGKKFFNSTNNFKFYNFKKIVSENLSHACLQLIVQLYNASAFKTSRTYKNKNNTKYQSMKGKKTVLLCIKLNCVF